MRGPAPGSVIERFWSKISFPAGGRGCWEWCGKRKGGYGAFNVFNRFVMAHRFSWTLSSGSEIPTRMFVCHRCDNPPCVNPSHLFLGTSLDNMRDMVAKGRSCIGSRHGRALVDEALVAELRSARSAGATVVSLAKRIGMSPVGMGYLLDGHTWKHVPGSVCQKGQ